jgi:hypothetical protein
VPGSFDGRPLFATAVVGVNEMFRVGASYTRDEIHDAVGGSKQAYIPTKGGSVVAVCVTTRLNPRAPKEILCGNGPQIAKAGLALASTTSGVPLFIKRSVNDWEYRGLFRVVGSYKSGNIFNAMVQGTGRQTANVTIAIELAPV